MIFLCKTSEVPEWGGLRVELTDRPAVAVFRSGSQYFVTDDLCTHGEASLADGEVEGMEIICPFHLGRFDLRDGRATAAPCVDPLRSYPTELRDGDIFAAID
jgi:nitrite reductase/ring-hydroxylating ferredoxin subunit